MKCWQARWHGFHLVDGKDAESLFCTLPELAEMAARARIEYTQPVCLVHRIHTMDDVKKVVTPTEQNTASDDDPVIQ